MSLDVDGSAILRAIADTPAVFGIGQAKVDSLALAVVLARLKDKLATIADLRRLRGVIGAASLGLVVEQLKDSELSTLARRLDPHHPELRGSDQHWQRARITEILGGAEPAQAAPRQGRTKTPARAPAKPSTAIRPKTGVAGQSKSLRAAREVAASSPPEPPTDTTQPQEMPKAPPRKRTPKKTA